LLVGLVWAADFEKALDAAMGSYYAALVASAQGNNEATQRQLLLAASRWAVVARLSVPPSAVLAGDPAWAAAVKSVTGALQRARERAAARDIVAAHAELEAIRHTLYDVRVRHNLLNFDDHLTDFHEAIERLSGHVAGPNEIQLKPKDFADLFEDFEAARNAWQACLASAGGLTSARAWQIASRDVSASLQEMDRAIASKNGGAAARAATSLKNRYFDLLTAVSHARGT
jgi:hypothetical protein